MAYCAPTLNYSCKCLYSAKCIIYRGPNLPNINTYTNDNIQEILIKINTAISTIVPANVNGNNLGTGHGIFSSMSGNVSQYKSLVAGTGITISHTGTEITISNAGIISSPDSIDWRVDVAVSGLAPLADGDSSVTLDGTGGMPDLRGYNINFFRGGVVQYTTDPEDGSSYYLWDKITGLLLLLGPTPQASLTEQMRITPTR